MTQNSANVTPWPNSVVHQTLLGHPLSISLWKRYPTSAAGARWIYENVVSCTRVHESLTPAALNEQVMIQRIQLRSGKNEQVPMDEIAHIYSLFVGEALRKSALYFSIVEHTPPFIEETRARLGAENLPPWMWSLSIDVSYNRRFIAEYLAERGLLVL